jgi:hypothetical protein
MAIKWIVCIIEKNGYILLSRLKGKEALIPRLDWFFPYIKLNEDESPRIAVKRLANELKIRVEAGKFLIKYVPSENPKVEQYFYTAKMISGVAQYSERFSQNMWIKPSQLMKYISSGVSSDIIDYLNSLEKTGTGYMIEG